jgi:hypothetical protein
MRLHCLWRQLAYPRGRRGAVANLATGRAFVRGVLSGEGVRQFSAQNTRCVIERARMEMNRNATPRIRLPSRRDMCYVERPTLRACCNCSGQRKGLLCHLY